MRARRAKAESIPEAALITSLTPYCKAKTGTQMFKNQQRTCIPCPLLKRSSSGAVWKSRWPSLMVSVEVKQHWTWWNVQSVTQGDCMHVQQAKSSSAHRVWLSYFILWATCEYTSHTTPSSIRPHVGTSSLYAVCWALFFSVSRDRKRIFCFMTGMTFFLFFFFLYDWRGLFFALHKGDFLFQDRDFWMTEENFLSHDRKMILCLIARIKFL